MKNIYFKLKKIKEVISKHLSNVLMNKEHKIQAYTIFTNQFVPDWIRKMKNYGRMDLSFQSPSQFPPISNAILSFAALNPTTTTIRKDEVSYIRVM